MTPNIAMPAKRDDVRRMLLRRELGGRACLGANDHLQSQLSSSIRCVRSWDPRQTVDNTHHGGIFNFGFSADGSLLAAACEKKSILMFDPHNASLISVKNEAHSDCVNCVRFLDSRTFVTCSDDTTVCLWDARYMKQRVRTLRGHSNWVKNIEYAAGQGYLLTSGFDGSIYMWDINRYTEDGVDHRRLFHTSGLMRSKLTPDSKKLVIATAGGYLMVIHDLDVTTLSHDLNGFKPTMYRLMQNSQWPTVQANSFNHLFTAKRNRVELISDFPPQDDAEMIASLELHPQGWCAVSRNTSGDENSEWTCIHDIQGPRVDAKILEGRCNESSTISGESESPDISTEDFDPDPEETLEASAMTTSGLERPGEFLSASGLRPSDVSSSVRRRFVAPIWVPESTTIHSTETPPRSSGSPGGEDPSAGGDSGASGDQESPDVVDANTSGLASSSSSRGGGGIAHLGMGQTVTFVFRSRPRMLENTLTLCVPDGGNRICRNVPRLSHYIEEPNVGRGFIKEVCFSNDGRLLCSPFAFGVRILAFNSRCQELCDCVPETAAPLHEVTSNISHSNVVVSVNYSPTQCMMVSGCLNGKIDFHQPVL